MQLFKKCAAEFIGTFVLVLCGCGTAAATDCMGAFPNSSYLMTALAFGLVIVAMAYSIGNISGCHINPAVSLAMLISKKITAVEFAGYIVSQFLGATAGAVALKLCTNNPESSLGSNALFNDDPFRTILIEAGLTFIFVIAIIGVTSKPEMSNVAGLVIGGTLTLVHLFGIHFTGTSVNPARSFGPAIISGNTNGLWVFIVAPLIGGALAALVYKFLAPKKD